MERQELLKQLEAHYKRCGWSVKRSADGTLLATGPSGVTWIGTAILAEDVDDREFEARLMGLAQQRMEKGGELCPLDLLPAADCEPALRSMLERLGLSRQPHVSVYSLAA